MLPSIFGENLLDEFFDEPWEKSLFGARNPLYGKHAKNLMKTDVKETGDHYEVDIDLPGFQKDEIQRGAAKRLSDHSAPPRAWTGTRRTRRAATSARSGTAALAAAASMWAMCSPSEMSMPNMTDGILMLTLPKKDQQTLPTQNRIAIE